MNTGDRGELLHLLAKAAEVEHSLMAQYLFAAYSFKQDASEGLTDEQLNRAFGWERMILLVARQEMEHLGLVTNLLTAVGGAPSLGHRRFPYATSLYGHVMALEPFSVPTLQKFVCFERPDEVDPADAFCTAPPVDAYTTVSALYARIKTVLIATAARTPNLFVGPLDAQVTGGELGTDFPRVGALGAGYDVFMRPVSDLPSALGVIDLVVEQGEGAPFDHEISHYRRFLDILEDFEQAGFDPARPVVTNPGGGTVVTNEAARAVMELFDEAYALLLALLSRLFAHTDESENEVAVLRALAFMPLMTMAIRPLAEVLTAMPAQDPDDGTTAGPSFDTGGFVATLPHREAAWAVLEEALHGLVARAAQTAAAPGMPARLQYIAESLDLVAKRFAAGMGIAGSP
ncbi:MAG TPA: ferritin-like protein [Solirubrobacteraceae bacterium]|nr:ferritin-like protein [Solirubrobacteraceae bacterium]